MGVIVPLALVAAGGVAVGAGVWLTVGLGAALIVAGAELVAAGLLVDFEPARARARKRRAE